MGSVGRPRRVNCRQCGRHTDECGPLSKRGKCTSCAATNIAAAATQIENRQGPMYEKWRREVLAAGLKLSERV